MGRALLVSRLAARDLRRRPAEAGLLLLAIAAATTTLTLGLVLHGVTDQPYQSTRAATAGPDVVAEVTPPPLGTRPADLAALQTLTQAEGVSGHSGPYPLVSTTLDGHGQSAPVEVEGRASASASIDQPKLTDGSWVREGGVVVERSFADAFDLNVGDQITLDGRRYSITGIAVTAAMAPYPYLWTLARQGHGVHLGLIWATEADTRELAPDTQPLSYVVNLKLSDPANAPAFVAAHNPSSASAPPGTRPTDPAPAPPRMQSWQQISDANANLIRNEQRALLTGSWLLALLALASIAVLVGGRMADQIRRVGLLKAVGATPQLVASVLLAEYLALALLAAAAGLLLGRLLVPLLTRPSAGLLGTAGTVPFTPTTIGIVIAVSLAVAMAATAIPALRAARTSTVLALADSARPPRRTPWLIALSTKLPTPLLLGLRIAARRPRRTLLCAVSLAITVSGVIAALAAQTQLHRQTARGAGLADPRTDRLSHVLLLITAMLVAQAAANTIVIAWATVLDARHTSALARALGATPQQVSAGISTAQLLPALAGALLGIPGGIALYAAVGPSSTTPAALWVLATILGALLATAALTALPARISARRPVADILQSELT